MRNSRCHRIGAGWPRQPQLTPLRRPPYALRASCGAEERCGGRQTPRSRNIRAYSAGKLTSTSNFRGDTPNQRQGATAALPVVLSSV